MQAYYRSYRFYQVYYDEIAQVIFRQFLRDWASEQMNEIRSLFSIAVVQAAGAAGERNLI